MTAHRRPPSGEKLTELICERGKKKGLRSSDLNPSYLVRLAGIEPTTPWFVAKYSIQLSYSR